jgi:hypothetical protein
LVTLNGFRAALDYAADFMIRCGVVDNDFLVSLATESEDWEAFYSSTIGIRKPGDLKVLYLCGPEPINDLEVLLDCGIRKQNIWAVESNGAAYSAAIAQISDLGLNLKIHRGGLDRFFNEVNEKFDIVYIDACGPFPGGKPNSISTISAVFQRERLNSLGVLITNFARPPCEFQEIYSKLFAYYFAPRYNDMPHAIFKAGADPAVAHTDPSYLLPFVSGKFDEAYSEFVTRFIVDLGRNIVPNARIFNCPDIRSALFSGGVRFKEAVANATRNEISGRRDDEDIHQFFSRMIEETGDIYLNPSGYPLLTFLERSAKDPALQKLLGIISSQKPAGGDTLAEAHRYASLLAQVLEGNWNVASPSVLMALAKSWFDKKGGFFCDVPLPNLLINSLMGIYGRPYFSNPRSSRRFRYVAKQTEMYTDMLVFDQCRYYFDQFPTVDLIPSCFRSLEFQLILRACLDRIGRYDFASSSHPFRGAALGGFGEYKGADRYDYRRRLKIT